MCGVLCSTERLVQSATLLAEFIFFSELTIYCVFLLEKALKDSIVAPYPVIFQALRRLTITCVQLAHVPH